MELNPSDTHRLEKFLNEIKDKTDSFLGYPVSKDFDYRGLFEFLQYPLNNLGDPFTKSTWQVDSRKFEQEVIEFMAELFRAEENDFWGYVTNGGSEGNLYGLYLARELYPSGIAYFSRETHYSVSKNLHLLNMRHIMIRSSENGEIDYEDLYETIKIHRDKPAIIFANIGTTMTEAKDDLTKIREILDRLVITERYIHSDAALCGGLAPFITPRPPFDFKDGADSISVSGHKSFGSPIPCGIVIARKRNVNRIARSIAYIGSLDTTITGSRNGLTPIFLWYLIKKEGMEGFKKRVNDALEMADYTLRCLKNMGIDAWRNPDAITVVLPEVPEMIKEKWQLATADGRTHLICMPGVRREQIDEFVEDLKQHREVGGH
ncbi:Histidine decarboxylase [Desulfamplus magnetovallimortis]|uniref:Histidine decarboxylase n=1 Tax=Desulfamplus magnetovallimortis TaxID=1246637 RepID=A0A1W1HB38_9BACT|nr:histidine decarboxylase [Desulfamplus magnetovallimortis]SLM29656.1 Histidine decarboxylase [Desulfamplus magnetovallimortis]